MPNEQNPKIRVLWADDQPEFIEASLPLIRMKVSEVCIVANGQEALERFDDFAPDLVILDLQMPPQRWGGLWFLKNIPERSREIPVVVLSGSGTLKECVQATRLGAADYVEKESVVTDLLPTIEKVLAEAQTARTLSDYDRVRRLERTLHNEIIRILGRQANDLGHPDVFRVLVPRKIAIKCYERLLESDDLNARQEHFLDLIDLATILDSCWSETAEFRLLEPIVKPRNRKARTSWLAALNEIRRTVAHPVRGEPKSEDRKSLDSAEDIVSQWVLSVQAYTDARIQNV